jgi:hypothetical protein
MPRRNRSGPEEKGPMTGWGEGECVVSKGPQGWPESRWAPSFDGTTTDQRSRVFDGGLGPGRCHRRRGRFGRRGREQAALDSQEHNVGRPPEPKEEGAE